MEKILITNSWQLDYHSLWGIFDFKIPKKNLLLVKIRNMDLNFILKLIDAFISKGFQYQNDFYVLSKEFQTNFELFRFANKDFLDFVRGLVKELNLDMNCEKSDIVCYIGKEGKFTDLQFQLDYEYERRLFYDRNQILKFLTENYDKIFVDLLMIYYLTGIHPKFKNTPEELKPKKVIILDVDNYEIKEKTIKQLNYSNMIELKSFLNIIE